ncbi:MAG: M16 family metallopeptidase [Myxococcota bacterium]
MTPDVGVHALSDGTPVWVVERHEVPLVRVELSLRRSGDEDAGALAALAALWERDEGTDAAEALGATLSLGCGAERCWMDLDAPVEHLAEALRVAGEALRTVETHDLAGVRRAWRAEWRTDWLAPELVPELALERLTWPDGHPRRSDHDAGFFRAMTPARVREAHARLLAEAAAGVVVVGDTRAAEVLPMLGALGTFGGAGARAFAGPTPDRWPRVVLVDLPGEADARIAVRVAAPGRDDPEATAFALAARALGGDFTGRLNLRLRERDGLAYGAYAEPEDGPGWGLLTARATVPAARAGEAVRAMAEELDAAALGFAPEEIAVARRLLAADAGAAADTRASLAFSLGMELLAGLSPGDTWRRVDTLADVSDVSVARAARFLAGPRLWVIAGDADALEPALEAAGLPPSTIWSACVAVYGSPC